MVDLIAISDHGTGEVFQEFSWVISFSRWLPIARLAAKGI